jgi:hypothetical protein
MDFIIWGSGSTKGFDTTGTCAYFDVEEEMRAIRKEWKRNEVVSLYVMTPGRKKIPKDLVKYFEEKPEHSGNLVLSKMLFDTSSGVFDDGSMAMRYNITIDNFTFTKSLLVRYHLYSEDGVVDYMDAEFALRYVTWRDKNNCNQLQEKA